VPAIEAAPRIFEALPHIHIPVVGREVK